MSVIFKRVSVRKYEAKPVEEEKVREMIQAGCAAPSAGNQQPWEFYIVRNQSILEKLSKVHQYSGFVKDADLAIVPCYRIEGLWAPQYAHIDMAACTENILLKATELGLGCTWIGIAPEEDRLKTVKEILNLPENLAPFCLIPTGYPAESRPQENRYEKNRIHLVE